jgi:hypothetical protein
MSVKIYIPELDLDVLASIKVSHHIDRSLQARQGIHLPPPLSISTSEPDSIWPYSSPSTPPSDLESTVKPSHDSLSDMCLFDFIAKKVEKNSNPNGQCIEYVYRHNLKATARKSEAASKFSVSIDRDASAQMELASRSQTSAHLSKSMLNLIDVEFLAKKNEHLEANGDFERVLTFETLARSYSDITSMELYHLLSVFKYNETLRMVHGFLDSAKTAFVAGHGGSKRDGNYHFADYMTYSIVFYSGPVGQKLSNEQIMGAFHSRLCKKQKKNDQKLTENLNKRFPLDYFLRKTHLTQSFNLSKVTCREVADAPSILTGAFKRNDSLFDGFNRFDKRFMRLLASEFERDVGEANVHFNVPNIDKEYYQSMSGFLSQELNLKPVRSLKKVSLLHESVEKSLNFEKSAEDFNYNDYTFVGLIRHRRVDLNYLIEKFPEIKVQSSSVLAPDSVTLSPWKNLIEQRDSSRQVHRDLTSEIESDDPESEEAYYKDYNIGTTRF